MQMKQTLLAVALGTALTTPASVWAGELEDLKADMQKMMQRIEQLEAQKGSGAKPAVTSGKQNVRLSLTGQVNRAVLFVDDGDRSETHHVDNDASSTRFRMIAEADASDTLTVGAAIELQVESNSSASVTQTTGADATKGSDSLSDRRLEVYFAGKDWGKLWLGQGWTASEGTSEEDLSGTALAGYSDIPIIAGSMVFRDSAGALSDLSIGAVTTNMDGLSRKDRIRYDTPGFGGFTVALSHTEDDGADVALRYRAKYNDGTQVVGALAYADPEKGGSVDDQVNGSVSVLLASGFNVTLAAGERDLKASGAEDPSFWYTKWGYQFGNNAVSVDYGETDDLAKAGDEATAFGAQYVRQLPAWATEAYIGVRQHELDRPSSDFDDITAVIAGARLKF